MGRYLDGNNKGYWGGRGGGMTNERPGSDHVIWGPMRGLKKWFKLKACVRTFIWTSRLEDQLGQEAREAELVKSLVKSNTGAFSQGWTWYPTCLAVKGLGDLRYVFMNYDRFVKQRPFCEKGAITKEKVKLKSMNHQQSLADSWDKTSSSSGFWRPHFQNSRMSKTWVNYVTNYVTAKIYPLEVRIF